jgi:hypothetical protein
MSENKYRPWREDPEKAPLLAPEAAATWNDLLAESRRSVEMLREYTGGIDRRLAAGTQLLQQLTDQQEHARDDARLEMIEQRLAALEQTLARLGTPGALRLSDPQDDPVATPAPMQHLLTHLLSTAA